MFRFSSAALAAAAFAASLSGLANANTTPSVHRIVPAGTVKTNAARGHAAPAGLVKSKQIKVVKAAVEPAVTVDEDGTAVASPAFHLMAPDTRAQLREVDAAAAASDSDMKMWLGDSPKPSKNGTAVKRFARGIINRTSGIAASLTRNAMRFIGTPYVFGGTSASGFDCSGYVQHVFAMMGISVPRTADVQYYAGRKIADKMSAGDLVFFQTYEPGPSHVGIYLGKGKFIHSSSHGVRVSSMSESYWSARYLGAKRVVPN